MTFARGDIVQLKSGGPLMTIANSYETKAIVAYFDNAGILQEGGIPSECLKLAYGGPQTPDDVRQMRSTGLA